MIEQRRFFVGGRWVEPATGATAAIVDPATEEPIGVAAVPSPADADAAIEAARRAFDEGPWPRMRPAERAAAMRRMHEFLCARRVEIGTLLMAEVGATLLLAKTFQGGWALDAFRRCADWAESFAWEESVEPESEPIPAQSVIVREPVGVVAAIAPFNFPFFVGCWKVAPAIAMGNTVVLKPAPWTPLDAFEIARAAEEAGIPPGVVNVIGGGGVDVGERMVSHPMVDMVSFTGSVPAGRRVGALAAETIKKVQLELGGKSALVVLDDAGPDRVATSVLAGCMIHAGQGCGCTTRMLVPAGRHDELVEAAVAACRAAVVGDPRDPQTVVGPLIRDEHRARVEAHVERARADGAVVATGARRPPGLDRGFFYEPTVLTGVTNDMAVAREEIFGPVLCVIPYRDEDEAVAIANDSPFGLGGSVVSADRERAMALARRLRTGYVGLGVVAPNFNGSWGGYRQSGVGREWRDGLSEYTESKHISWLAP